MRTLIAILHEVIQLVKINGDKVHHVLASIHLVYWIFEIIHKVGKAYGWHFETAHKIIEVLF
jgi:hypothetical protein